MSGLGDDEKAQQDGFGDPIRESQRGVFEGYQGHASQQDGYKGQPPRLFVAINAARVGPARDPKVQALGFDATREVEAPAVFDGELLSVAGSQVVTKILEHLANSLEKHPVHEAWKSKAYDVTIFKDPLTPEEEWARLVAEKFCGLAYFGPDILAGFSKTHVTDGATYIYTRFQPETHLWLPVVDPKTGQSRLALALDAPTHNFDPAYSLGAACEYVSTYVTLSRGFSIEDDLQSAPLPCSQEVGERPIFSQPGGAWLPTEIYNDQAHRENGTYEGPGKGLNKMEAAIKAPPPMAEGAVFVFNPNGYQPSRWFQVTDDQANALDSAKSKVGRDSVGTRIQTEGAAAADKQQQPEGTADGSINLRPDHEGVLDLARDLSKVFIHNGARTIVRNIRLRAQDPGSHICSVLRTYKHPTLGQVAQLFETAAHVNDQRPQKHHPYHLTEPTRFEGTYDNDPVTEVHARSFVGMGVLPTATKLAAGVASLGQSRPVGLFRIVITTWPDPKKIWEFKVTPNNTLYVSPIMRMYGEDSKQNFAPAELLWALRNTPYYRTAQVYLFAYAPHGDLADAMWEEGARVKTVSELIEVVTAARAVPAAKLPTQSVKLQINTDLFPVGVYTHDQEGLVLMQWRSNNGNGQGHVDPSLWNMFGGRLWIPPTTPMQFAQDDLQQSYVHPSMQAEQVENSDEDYPVARDTAWTVPLPDFFKCCL